MVNNQFAVKIEESNSLVKGGWSEVEEPLDALSIMMIFGCNADPHTLTEPGRVQSESGEQFWVAELTETLVNLIQTDEQIELTYKSENNSYRMRFDYHGELNDDGELTI